MTLVPLHDPLRLATYTPISPADVIVFREGDYAVAVDGKTKEVLARSTDHANVIQRALDYAGSLAWDESTYPVVAGVGLFEITKTITIPERVICNFKSARFRVVEDVDVVKATKRFKILGLTIDVSAVEGFTKRAVVVENPNITHPDHAFEIVVKVLNGYRTGTAVELYVDQDGAAITLSYVRAIVDGFEKALSLRAVNSAGCAYINSNTFDVTARYSKYGIYMERNKDLSLSDLGLNSNLFRVHYIAGSDTIAALKISGRYNVFLVDITDIVPYAPETAKSIIFDTDAKGNIVLGKTESADRIEDNGSYNWVLGAGLETERRKIVGVTEVDVLGKGNIMVFNGTSLFLEAQSADDIAHFAVLAGDNKVTDSAWAFIARGLSDNYPRLRIAPNGTISFGDGASPPNIVIQNVSGKARIYNVDSLQLPLYTDCANLPASGNFTGDARACYDTDAGKWVLKVWDGSNWQTIG